MKRRDLFRGAGALALSAAIPAAPAEAVTGPTFGLDLAAGPVGIGVWLVLQHTNDLRQATWAEAAAFDRALLAAP